jgi:hypothetical protein
MKRFGSALPFLAVFVLFWAAGVQGQQVAPSPTNLTLGVSLEVAEGHAIAFPVQAAGAREDQLPVIPMPGHKKVSGLRIYPFMNGDQVAVRVSALVPARSSNSPARVQRVGEYVIGHTGDSLKLAALAKLGLRPLALTVVKAPFLTDAAEDPCCFNNQGLICCGGTLAQMCANCPDCCGGFAPAKNPSSSRARCVQNPAATPDLKSKLAVNKSN